MYLMRRKKTRKSKLSLCMMSEYVLSISMYVPLLTFQKETQTDHTCFPLSCQKAKIFATRWRYNALMPCDLEEIRLKPNKLAMVALCQPQWCCYIPSIGSTRYIILRYVWEGKNQTNISGKSVLKMEKSSQYRIDLAQTERSTTK